MAATSTAPLPDGRGSVRSQIGGGSIGQMETVAVNIRFLWFQSIRGFYPDQNAPW